MFCCANRRGSLIMKIRPIKRVRTRQPLEDRASTNRTSRPGLSADLLARIDAYWRAANYLSVGQIYLLANPLLKKPLRREHIKPRLLGHWGTTPGLNLVYAHLNRAIKEKDLNVIYI